MSEDYYKHFSNSFLDSTSGPARYPVTKINYPIMKARRQVDLTKKMVVGPSPPAYTMGIRHTAFREFYNKIQ